jgi:predicted site-specific integrase-resolvase
MTDRWMAPKEFAAALGVHISTVRRWIWTAEPSIEVLRVGSVIRVRARACECASVLTSQPKETTAR